MKYKNIVVCKLVTLLSLISCIVLLGINIGISEEIGFKLMGLSLFCLIFKMCEYIKDNSICDKIIFEISKDSYAIFLLQHIAILKVVNAWNPTSIVKVLILLVLTIFLIICEAKILVLVTNSFVSRVRQRYLTIKNR